jgi:hypothetical protein
MLANSRTCFYRPKIPKRVWVAGVLCSVIPEPRCDRLSVRYPLWGFLGASRIHAFAGCRFSLGGYGRFCHVPLRYIWDRTIWPIRVFVSGYSKSRSARCDDERRAGSGILFALRQQALSPSLATDPRFTDCSPSVLQRTWIRHSSERSYLDLGSRDSVCDRRIDIASENGAAITVIRATLWRASVDAEGRSLDW